MNKATAESHIFKCGDSRLELRITDFGGKAQPVLIKPHDNEITAFAAAKKVMSEQGGRLIEVINGYERNVTFSLGGKEYVFDPNRIYSPEGIRKTLRNNGRVSVGAIEAVKGVSEWLLPHFQLDKQRYTCAIHNNTEGWFSIKSYINKDVSKRLFINKKHSIDDFYIVNTEQAYDFFASRGFNIVLLDQKYEKDDGSLSVYAGSLGVKYVNIEAMHNHIDENVAMIEAWYDFLRAISEL